METLKIKRYGWHPGLPNHNAPKFGKTISTLAATPPVVDLRHLDSPIYDQGDLGSCTANAISGMVQYVLKYEGKPNFMPSRLFIYYNERVIEGTVDTDAGAALADGIKVINTMGVPHESLWWYNTAKFSAKPSKSVYTDALNHKALSYLGLNNSSLSELKTCLAMGYPFVFGITVFAGIESKDAANTGIIPLPSKNQSALGGHALCCVGYNDSKQMFIVRNSWGSSWGDRGYAYLPYDYLINTDMAQDFWTIHSIS